MILGELELPVLSVRGLSQSDAYAYATHAVVGGKPRMQRTGDSSPNVELLLRLHAEHVSPAATLAELRRLASDGEALVLQTDAGELVGQFVITAIDDRPVWTLPDGFVVLTEVSVRLSDPGLEVLEEAPEASALEGGSAATTTELPDEDRSTPRDEVATRDIARRGPA